MMSRSSVAGKVQGSQLGVISSGIANTVP